MTRLRKQARSAERIVEGVSALNPALTQLYGLKLFIGSDSATVLRAAESRGGGVWFEAWRTTRTPDRPIPSALRSTADETLIFCTPRSDRRVCYQRDVLDDDRDLDTLNIRIGQ